MITDTPVNLFDLDRAALGAFMGSLGEKPFRAQQVMKWIYHQGVTDFADMTNLSLALREQLVVAAGDARSTRCGACAATLDLPMRATTRSVTSRHTLASTLLRSHGSQPRKYARRRAGSDSITPSFTSIE